MQSHIKPLVYPQLSFIYRMKGIYLLKEQCGCTVPLTSVPSHKHWKLSKDQAVRDFQMRSIKIDKCTPRAWCPAEPDQITSQYTPGMQILHTIKHVSDAQKDINLALENRASPQREQQR